MWTLWVIRVRDHPRGCGEESVRNVLALFPLGSSPRVRGRGATPPPGIHAPGIIPAGAGKRREEDSR